MQDVQESAFVPTTNLSETKHASWLASIGNKQMLNVYDACVSNLANALLQSAKMLAFVEEKYKGAGPSTENLVRRVLFGKYTPNRISTKIEENILGTPMYRQPSVEGDNITVSKKQKSIGIVLEEEENAAHKPEYVTQNQARNKMKVAVN